MSKDNRFESTVWTDLKNPVDNVDLVEKSCIRDERKIRDMYKQIERAAMAQLYVINDGSPEFRVGWDGVMEFELKNNCHPKSDDEIAAKIFEATRSGVYARHQFKDWEGKGTRAEYAAWFDLAKESYLQTMPLKQLLSLSDWDLQGNETKELQEVFAFHGCEEEGDSHSNELYVTNDGLGGYSIDQIKKYLELYFEPYVMLSLIGKNIHVEEFKKIPYLVCSTNGGNKIAISVYAKEIFAVSDKKLISLGNSYEYLFKKLGLPLEVVINSIMVVMNRKALPNCGLNQYRTRVNLVDKVKSAVDSKGFDEAKHLGRKSFYYELKDLRERKLIL